MMSGELIVAVVVVDVLAVALVVVLVVVEVLVVVLVVVEVLSVSWDPGESGLVVVVVGVPLVLVEVR